MIKDLLKKLAGPLLEATTDAGIFAIILKLWNAWKSPEFQKIHRQVVRHGSSAKAEFIGRASALLTPEEFERLVTFMQMSLNPEERTAFRCSVVAIDQYDQEQRKTLERDGAKTTEESCVCEDRAKGFLKLLTSDKLNNNQRKEICKAAGFLDPHFDYKNVLIYADKQLSTAGDKIGEFRLKMEAALLPQPLPANAKRKEKLFHRIKNLY
ncbi:MAG: hypothetical protein NT170_04415 [Candidatus Moranbacteria bacterium]|nr:hypothetical protein [Candidatus Moranbacteria bacterium]